MCVVLTDTEGEYRMDVANLGDCRAVVARLDGNKYTCVCLEPYSLSLSPYKNSKP